MFIARAHPEYLPISNKTEAYSKAVGCARASTASRDHDGKPRINVSGQSVVDR
jgi:hypothetical protein